MKIGANGFTISLENDFGVVIAKDNSGNQLIKLFGKAEGLGNGVVLNNKGLYIAAGDVNYNAYKVFTTKSSDGLDVLCLNKNDSISLW